MNEDHGGTFTHKVTSMLGAQEECSVSYDTEHLLKGPDRLLAFHAA